MDAQRDAPDDQWETCARWLATNDQFDFDNVAVSHPIADDVKLLACADCERGPIGIVLFKRSPPLFLVSEDRMKE